jgi:hypothetical protein
METDLHSRIVVTEEGLGSWNAKNSAFCFVALSSALLLLTVPKEF